ncbi:MAG TPA: CBS domain-containing protein [Euzebyales bacterium]
MRVREWMSPDPVTIEIDETVRQARELLSDHGFRHLPVVERGSLVGIVSDRDVMIRPRALRAAMRDRAVEDLLDDARPVEAVMSSSPHVIAPDAAVDDAARLLVSRRVGALPVVDADDGLVGIITAVDCLLASLQPEPGFS